jgi:hypothetical protein
MKKIILATFLAVSVFGMTSCNSNVEPIEYPPQSLMVLGLSDLMRNGLFNIYAYEESISKKIANDETLDPSIVIEKDAADNVTGWTSNFSDASTLFTGSIHVTFTGSPLDNGSVKHIDCSGVKTTSAYGNLTLFGTIDVTNNQVSDAETSCSIATNQFGWGSITNDININANYEFNTKYNSSDVITECTVTGYASGHHSEYGSFSQDIISTLYFGQNVYFIGGEMYIFAAAIGEGLLPIVATFSQVGINITFNGETISY